MDTQMMVWIAATGGFASMISVIIALLAGMRYGTHLRRMPAATALENVVERLQVGHEELKRIEAESRQQWQERNALKAELDGIIVRRKEEEGRLQDIRQELASLDSRRTEIEKIREELAEGRIQLAELVERRTEYEQLAMAIEKTRAQLASLDERKAEIEALDTAERDARSRLTEALGKLDYADRQVTTARAETARLAAEQKKLLTEIQGFEEKKIQLQSELAQLCQDHDPLVVECDKIRQEIETASEDLKSTRKQRQKIEEDLDQLRFMRASLEATTATTRSELETVQTQLIALKDECKPLAAELAELEATRKQRFSLEEELANLRAVRANTEAAVTTSREVLAVLQAELKKLRKEQKPLAEELDSLRREIASNRERRQELEEALASLYTTRAFTVEAVTKTQQEWEAAKENLVAVQNELQPQQKEMESLRRKIAEARDRQQNLDDEYDQTLARLKAIENRIEDKLKELQAIETPTGDGEPETDSVLADLVRSPACLSDQNHSQPTASEQDALQQVRRHLEVLNLHFPERTLYAFHTALKIAPISPLTVLAGISGTGKSQLPRRYAEAMGIHFLKIPVQPRWDSPQDMLGFYNYLEKRYKATELARALVHFDPYNWPTQAATFKDRLLLVLLDEMNLARVEYYFSEFLSQLEGRPGPDQPDRDGIHKSEITLDIGGASGRSCRIYPGHNMLFVGTMNEDESTQTLSDKVLDRANLLRFPRPNRLVEEASTEPGAPMNAYLPASRWHGWRRRFVELPDHLRSKITKLVHELNGELDELHRPFAHRVNQAMLAYIANYPGVAEPNRGDGWESARLAFADQLEQRILPKLRGIDLADVSISQPLRKIGEMIRDELHDEALYAAFQRASQDDGSGRPFLWMGVRRENDS